VRPSPHDLRAAGATVEMVERAGKPLVFVLNAAAPRAKITSEAAVALSQHGTVAPVTLYHRIDYAAGMIDGRTVIETDPEGRSAAEIRELWAYIADRLAKSEPIPPPPLAATTPILRATPIQVNALGQRMKSFGRRAVQ